MNHPDFSKEPQENSCKFRIDLAAAGRFLTGKNNRYTDES
jgi:hypothetical protein